MSPCIDEGGAFPAVEMDDFADQDDMVACLMPRYDLGIEACHPAPDEGTAGDRHLPRLGRKAVPAGRGKLVRDGLLIGGENTHRIGFALGKGLEHAGPPLYTPKNKAGIQGNAGKTINGNGHRPALCREAADHRDPRRISRECGLKIEEWIIHRDGLDDAKPKDKRRLRKPPAGLWLFDAIPPKQNGTGFRQIG